MSGRPFRLSILESHVYYVASVEDIFLMACMPSIDSRVNIMEVDETTYILGRLHIN